VAPPARLTAHDFLGCWREGECSYLFFAQPKEAQVREWLAAHPEQGTYLSATELNYTDWEAGQAFRPTRIAGFYLCPIWEDPEPRPGDLLIRLEPGLAFGSGYHPTTRLCLRLLVRIFEEGPVTRVLDLGTGTGVLTLASLALGAERAVAVEYNELAVRTAQRNLWHNRQAERVSLIQGDARRFAYPAAEVALANIHLDVLTDLLAVPEFFTKTWYIFSGILGTQMVPFREALAPTPLEVVDALDENLWYAVLAYNREAK
jgi:ribosomal protein L11 methyltransferase